MGPCAKKHKKCKHERTMNITPEPPGINNSRRVNKPLKPINQSIYTQS